jgi:SAM-dependent methyltransferase
MAHAGQLNFVEKVATFFPAHFTGSRVVEIGSLDINGSVRKLFPTPARYVGVDLEPGPGVDVTCLGHEFSTDSGTWDTVLSCESFEHNPHFRETFVNMARLARPGGLVLFTCATSGRPEHGTERSSPGSSPFTVQRGWEYYRNVAEKDFDPAVLDRLFECRAFFVSFRSADLYFVGLTRGAAPESREVFDTLRSSLFDYYRRLNRKPRYVLQQGILILLERLGPVGRAAMALRRSMRAGPD